MNLSVSSITMLQGLNVNNLMCPMCPKDLSDDDDDDDSCTFALPLILLLP